MTEASTADSLEARVAAAPTPEERAALLGLDYPRLVVAHHRLRWLSSLGVSAVTFAISLPVMLGWLLTGETDLVGVFLRFLLGAFVAVVLSGAALIGATVVLALPGVRDRSATSRRLVLTVLAELLCVVAIVVATQLNGTGEWLAGVLIGTTSGQLLALSGQLAVKPAIEKNTKQQVALVEGLADIPDWLSPTRGDVRWTVAAAIASMVSVAGAVLIIWSVPLAAVAVAGLLVATALVAARAAGRSHPRVWLAVQLVGAAVLLATGLIVYLA